MSIFLTSIQSVLAIVLMIVVGYLAQKAGYFGENFSNSLSKLIMRIALPLSIFRSMLEHFNPTLLSKLGTGLIYVIISVALDYLVAFLLTRVFRVPRGKRGLMIQAITGANTVFIGMPLNDALFGTGATAYLLVYYIINTIVIWTVGVWVIANDDPTVNGKNENVKFDLSHLLPVPLYGFIVALPFIYIKPLKDFYMGITFLSKTFVPGMAALVVPLSLIYIGIMLQKFGLKNMEFDSHIILTIIGRFVISPIIMGLVIMAGAHILGIGLVPTFQKTLIIQSATPTLAVLPIMANEYHGDVKYATNVVVSTSILFVVVVPVIMMLQSVL